MYRNLSVIEKKRELGLDIEPFIFDEGCQVATLYLRINNIASDSKCTANCPFPECIDNLTTNDRKIINRANDLKQLYDLYDQGIPLPLICKQLHINPNDASRYLQNRDKVKILLDEWGEIISSQTKNFVIKSS